MIENFYISSFRFHWKDEGEESKILKKNREMTLVNIFQWIKGNKKNTLKYIQSIHYNSLPSFFSSK